MSTRLSNIRLAFSMSVSALALVLVIGSADEYGADAILVDSATPGSGEVFVADLTLGLGTVVHDYLAPNVAVLRRGSEPELSSDS